MTTGGEEKQDVLSRGDKAKIARMRGDLLDWYRVHGRDFPWRKAGASIFERVCVEVLLQRTRVETVALVYPRFFSRFTGWGDIAVASPDELEEMFRPLGLWRRRAAALKAMAAYASEHNGMFPASKEALADVPAVGQYVMNAILLFQHGQAKPLLDVNMARLLERFLRPREKADLRHDPWLQAAAHWLVRGGEPITVNWAVLDFASLVCRRRSPKCETCLLRTRCNCLKDNPSLEGRCDRF